MKLARLLLEAAAQRVGYCNLLKLCAESLPVSPCGSRTLTRIKAMESFGVFPRVLRNKGPANHQQPWTTELSMDGFPTNMGRTFRC